MLVSTHSRPKAAAIQNFPQLQAIYGFNTQPPEGGCPVNPYRGELNFSVSTHSRPKAAASHLARLALHLSCFNTQPPEGGCVIQRWKKLVWQVSTHSRPKAAAFNL